MSVLYRQSLAAPPFVGRRLYHSPPLSTMPDGGLPWSRRLRLHFPELTELLEDWYDRTAENCDRFVNISEVDKYSITCTVCRHFDAGGCFSTGAAPVDIVALLHRARQHDTL